MDRKALVKRLREVPLTERVITALDVAAADDALALARRLGSAGRWVKVGLELYTAAGPAVIGGLRDLGKEVFLDLKLHDIPNTVAGAARIACDLQVAMLTIHAAAGRRSLETAAEALAARTGPGVRPALLGVTVLTSLSAEELQEVSPARENLPERILNLARLAWSCGCDGLVCAPLDLPPLRAELGPEPLVITPGIRPAAAGADDQRRTATPAAAIAAGSDYLVIGRPITQAPDPGFALRRILEEFAT
jgi:orotidine-5'-phosphate decarboxylase